MAGIRPRAALDESAEFFLNSHPFGIIELDKNSRQIFEFK
jgi:hypothetical protein